MKAINNEIIYAETKLITELTFIKLNKIILIEKFEKAAKQPANTNFIN